MLSLTTQMALAETPKPDCRAVIRSADAALEAKDKALSLSDLALSQCREAYAQSTTEVNQLRDAESSWFHNPFALFVMGAVAGVATAALLKK